MHDAIKTNRVEYIPALFLVTAIVCLPIDARSDSLNALAIVFVSIVLEAIPFMMIGSLVGGFIETFISRQRLSTLLPQKGWMTVCVAAGAGLVFPVCECAVVPVVRRLIGKGLPFSAAIAYLLGGPIVNPIVAASTAIAYAFDWRIVLLRMGLGFFLAVVIGLLMGKLFAGATAIKENDTPLENNATPGALHHPACCREGSETMQRLPVITEQAANHMAHGCGCSHPRLDRWLDKVGAAFSYAKDDFLTVGHYLVIGAFIAALAQTYIDRSIFLSLTAVPVLSIVLMMVLAIMLNLCSEADAFIAASFQGLMPISSQMGFLLTGPMFDLKLLLMYQTVFKRRAIVALSTLILVCVLAIAIGLEMINGVRQ